MSEALIFASTNPQYDDRLFIELQVQYMKIPSSNLGRTCCVLKLFLTCRTIFAQNMFSPCPAKKKLLTKIYLYGPHECLDLVHLCVLDLTNLAMKSIFQCGVLTSFSHSKQERIACVHIRQQRGVPHPSLGCEDA